MKMAEEIAIFFADVRVGSYHLARNDKHMHRSLRVYVTKRDAPIIFVYDGRRDSSLDNLQKYVVFHHGSAPLATLRRSVANLRSVSKLVIKTFYLGVRLG